MNNSEVSMLKSAEQIASIQQVQKAAEEAMQEVIEYIQGNNQRNSEQAHKIIDQVLAKYECESPEGHIVAGGIQASEPHEIGTGILPKNQPIVIDIYPRSKTNGYWGDITRTIAIGEVSEEVKYMYQAVLEAQKLAIDMVKPGVICEEIHLAVETHFAGKDYTTSGTGNEFKYAQGFVHSLGHGVGKNIHETPKIGIGSGDTLKEGDVITIEPGLYYKNVGGIRIEDLLVVTKDGYKNLTSFSKQFVY